MKERGGLRHGVFQADMFRELTLRSTATSGPLGRLLAMEVPKAAFVSHWPGSPKTWLLLLRFNSLEAGGRVPTI